MDGVNPRQVTWTEPSGVGEIALNLSDGATMTRYRTANSVSGTPVTGHGLGYEPLAVTTFRCRFWQIPGLRIRRLQVRILCGAVSATSASILPERSAEFNPVPGSPWGTANPPVDGIVVNDPAILRKQARGALESTVVRRVRCIRAASWRLG